MAPGESVRGSLHEVLRSSTARVHQRLHEHPGLSALQSGQIDQEGYRALLKAFYGFYVPLENAAQIEPIRSGWLKTDLGAVGMAESEVARIPLCPLIPALDTPARQMGAQYVVEGSALGGQALARRLDPLLGPQARTGRTFLVGRGGQTGAAWKRFLGRLQDAEENPSMFGEIVAGATSTFIALERWLANWHQR